MSEQTDKKQLVLDTISDTVTDLLYYDRKSDEELLVGEIEAMVISGEITVDEMVQHFRMKLVEGIANE